ncbi:MAG: type II toxin-antitoxin system prevent-host-death family antitoxin [Candidatus Omnitrophota bacterium]|nr:type II toxin-antitoxin system prevent-host-death family antitoxin [Candidatus Omnitrophota bacterium]
MRFVSVRDLRGKSSEIWRRVSAEKDVVVTSNGHPIAILSAVSEDNIEESLAAIRQARAAQAVESMQREATASGRDRLPQAEIDAEIRAVRRARAR